MRKRRSALAVAVAVALLTLAVAVPAFAATTATTETPGWAGAVCRGTSTVATAVSDLLGMSSEDIAAQRGAGKSLADIAASKNVDKDKLVDTILSAKKAAMDEAVKDGRITQEQADQMLETMKSRVTDRVDDATVGPRGGRGQGGGMGMGRGMGLGGGMGGAGCTGAAAGGAPTTSANSL